MKKNVVASVAVAVALVATSCGGGGSGSGATSVAAFTDQLSAVCRTLGRGITDLDSADSLEKVRSNANDASALYEDAVNELNKLKVPTSDKEFASDAQDLISSYEDQIDTLDAIAKAARDGDQATVDSKISELTKQAADSNDLADSLDVSRCQLDSVFTATTTTTTTPTTEPALTLPIVTEPPVTLPVDTTPVDTAPPDTNKVVLSSSDLVPLGDYTFADAPDDAIHGFRTLLDLSPTVLAQSGRLVGVDVIDSSGNTMGRLFAFESDSDPLTPGSMEEVTPFITSDTPTTPKTVGTLDGQFWSDPDGTANFLIGVSNVILWSFAPTEDLLDQTLQAWGESISQ